MLEIPKPPFLVLHFSYYMLMTFLMLSVILLSMLMLLLSTLIVIKHLSAYVSFVLIFVHVKLIQLFPVFFKKEMQQNVI